MKYYIIAGEASGDLHGSNLMKQLKVVDQDAQFRVWGGDKMQAAGGELVKHYRDLAFMGFVEVVANLRTILGNISFCKKDIIKWQPDALVLVDYPGFNLRIAKWAHTEGLKVIYYISPQIWAWHQSRVHAIKRDVDLMLTILPFEEHFYAQYDMEVKYVGHPLLDVVDEYEPEYVVSSSNDERPILALLPGSRKQEIQRVLPEMLSVYSEFSEYRFVIAAAPSASEEWYTQIINGLGLQGKVEVIDDKTYDLLSRAKLALVTSGTATLETALFKVPQIVCYKGSSISYQIAKRVIKTKYISLVNLVADKQVVRELIQQQLNRRELISAINELQKTAHLSALQKDYETLQQKLGGPGASKRAAQEIVNFLAPQ